MSKPDDLLANADRLLADARYLYERGSSRSAATLIVVALEQFGAFVEAMTLEAYPDATIHLGIFGPKANAHAKRQDALVAHIQSFVLGALTSTFTFEIFFENTGSRDDQEYMQWLLKGPKPIRFTEAQIKCMEDSPEMKAASLLLRLVRQNRLQQLREYGFYENTEFAFSEDAIEQVLSLAETIQEILAFSRHAPMPKAIRISGINMPEGQKA